MSIRNLPPEAVKLVASTKALIDDLKQPDGNLALDEVGLSNHDYVKAVDRIFKRIDDGTIFFSDCAGIIRPAWRCLSRLKKPRVA